MVFANVKGDESHGDRVAASAQQKIRLAGVGNALQPEAASSISSGLSIVGKIIGQGPLTIFGSVEGEVRASTVVIAEGAQMLGDVVAEELRVGGQIKGTIYANRVKLNSTGVVGAIFSIEHWQSRRMLGSRECRAETKIRSILKLTASRRRLYRSTATVNEPPKQSSRHRAALHNPFRQRNTSGVVSHYYGHLSVVVMQLEPGAMLRVGDLIRIRGHTTDFTQKIESLEINRAPVSEVGPNDDFGLKVIEHAREHDAVFKVAS